MKERKDYHAEVEEQKKRDKIEDKELRQWILMQGLKRDEIDKLHEIKRKESAWASKMTVRDAYNNQIVSSEVDQTSLQFVMESIILILLCRRNIGI